MIELARVAWHNDPAVALLISFGMVLLFAAAAVHKLRAPGVFAATLGEYRLLPSFAVVPMAWLLVVVELAVAVGFALSATRAIAAATGALLLVSYACAIAINLMRGRRDLECGCSMQARPIGAWMILRNVLAAALAALLVFPDSGRPLAAADLATVGGGLVVLSLLYMSADLLLGRATTRLPVSLERS